MVNYLIGSEQYDKETHFIPEINGQRRLKFETTTQHGAWFCMYSFVKLLVPLNIHLYASRKQRKLKLGKQGDTVSAKLGSPK